ncbi:MAG: transposase [Candidatus Glassbacteria bacterium]
MNADFNGGTLTSDGGALFLREVERGVGVIRRLVEALLDNRHQSYVDHSYEELVSQRVYQIACGYEDANDCNEMIPLMVPSR